MPGALLLPAPGPWGGVGSFSWGNSLGNAPWWGLELAPGVAAGAGAVLV